MSPLSVLKTIGKDLSHVGSWIDDGLKALGPIVSVVDPPLAPIVIGVEAFIEQLQSLGGPSAKQLTSSQLQAIVTSFATIESLKSSLLPKLSAPVTVTLSGSSGA